MTYRTSVSLSKLKFSIEPSNRLVSFVDFDRLSMVRCKTTDISIDKEGGSFGFTIRGGSWGPDITKSRPITITAIRTGGPADR